MAEGVKVGSNVSFIKPNGEQVWIPDAEADALARSGVMRPETPEEYDRRVKSKAFGDPSHALFGGVLRSMTLGGSDVLTEALVPGAVSAQKEAQPALSAVGEIGGTIAGPGMVGAKLLKGATGLGRVGIATGEGAVIGGGAGVSRWAQGADPSAIGEAALTGAAVGGALSVAGLGLAAVGRKAVRRGQSPEAQKVVALTQGKAELRKDELDKIAAFATSPKAQQREAAYQQALKEREAIEVLHGQAARKNAQQAVQTNPVSPEKGRALEAERVFRQAENDALRKPTVLSKAERSALQAEEKLTLDKLAGLREKEGVAKRVVDIERLDKELRRYERVRVAAARVRKKLEKEGLGEDEAKVLKQALRRHERKSARLANREELAQAKRARIQDELDGIGFTAQQSALEARIAAISAKLHPQTSAVDTAKVAARIAKNEEKIASITNQLGEGMAHRSAVEAVEGPAMALKAAQTNVDLAKRDLQRVASELGFADGALPRTGVFVGDLAQAGGRMDKAITAAQKDVFSFGVPGLSSRLFGLGLGVGAGLSTKSVLGGLAALAGVRLAEKSVRKAVVALGKGDAKSLSSALLGTGRVAGLSSISLLTQDQVEQARNSANQLSPAQTKAAAAMAYKEGGVDDTAIPALADFQARRLAAAQQVLNSGQSPATITKGMAVVRDPRVFLKVFSSNTVTALEVQAFATVSPPVFNQMKTSAKIALEEGKVKDPRMRRNIAVLLNGHSPYARTTMAMYSLAKQKEKEQRGEIRGKQAGRSHGGRPPGTDLQRIERQGIGSK